MKTFTTLNIIAITLFVISTTSGFCDPEFLVNTYTESYQNRPVIAMDSGGNFVVAWNCDLNDDDNYEVFARLFDINGNPLSDEFQVNTNIEDDQWEPSVGMDSNGNFVITWDSVGQDGDKRGIYAQRFDSTGNTVGEEFQVNNYTADHQREPEMAMSHDGKFVITWSSKNQEGEGYGVYAKLFNADGTVLKDEFQVNNITSGNQHIPYVSMNGAGDFVITWSSASPDDVAYDVYAKKYDGEGNTLIDEFQVNTYDVSEQYYSTVIIDDKGNFIVSWSSKEEDDFLSPHDEFAKIYGSNGNVIKEEFMINSITKFDQGNAVAGIDSEGNFVFTWGCVTRDGYDFDVYARGFDHDGNPMGDDFQVNTVSYHYQDKMKIAMHDDGTYVIVYGSYYQVSSESKSDIFARIFHIDDTPPADIVPPYVKIESPEDEQIVQGTVRIEMKAFDLAGIASVELKINDSDWIECLKVEDTWTYILDTSSYIVDQLELTARATDSSENANIGYSKVINLVLKGTHVDIYTEGYLFFKDDVLDVKVRIENTKYDLVDLYVACQIGGNLYWYPAWSDIPSATGIFGTEWEETILSITYDPALKGSYPFYAAITESGTTNVLGFDYVSVNVK